MDKGYLACIRWYVIYGRRVDSELIWRDAIGFRKTAIRRRASEKKEGHTDNNG